MAQQDKLFTAFFLDTTTAPWTPLTGLSATITIREVDTWTEVVSDVAMTEIWAWWYKYIFDAMNTGKDYVYYIDPNSSLAFMESWVTDKRLNYIDRNISDIKWGWGFWVSWADVQRYIKSSQSILIEEINKINEQVKKLEEKELPEQEEIDFTPILDKIDEVKQTKNPWVTTSIGTLKMQITKLSDFLRKEQENEKKEMEKKHQEKMKEKDAEMEMIEKTFEMVSKEYEDKIAEKEQENDSLLEEIEQMLEEINAKTEEEKQAIAEEIKNKILSSL